MKYMQIVVHTHGGEVRSAPEQVTERDYENMKQTIRDSIAVEMNTEDGWVVIPSAQIYYVEIKLV